jgi:trigger factor
MEKGQERDVKVTFPEDYRAEDLAGKEAVFHVKLNGVQAKNLPELDDEFAKDVSEFDTLADYRADVEKRLTQQAQTRSDNEFTNAVSKRCAPTVKWKSPSR